MIKQFEIVKFSLKSRIKCENGDIHWLLCKNFQCLKKEIDKKTSYCYTASRFFEIDCFNCSQYVNGGAE